MKTPTTSRTILLFFIPILAIVTTDLMAQTAFQITFEGQGEADARSVIEFSDGAFILTSKTHSIRKGKSRAYLVKTDIKGLSSEFPLTQIASGTE